MGLEDVAKAHSGTIKDSTLCGMTLDDFYKAMISVVFPGFTSLYAEDEKCNNEIGYSPDDIAFMLYSARVPSVKRTYYIENPLGINIKIPEFIMKDDQKYLDETLGIEDIMFRPFRKHPLYIKAENLARLIRTIDSFYRLGIYRPHAVIDALAPYLQYKSEPFSDLAGTIVKWLTSHIGVEHRNVFVDYLANKDEKGYHELYVELVQFIHEYLTEQDNSAKFEL